MKKKLIIYGVTEMASYVSHYFNRDLEYEVVAYTVEEKYIENDSFFGKKIVPFEKILNFYLPEEIFFFIAIGPSKMNFIREKYFNEVKSKGYKLINYVSKFAVVDSKIGENNFIGDFAVINPNVKVGDNNIIYEHSIVSVGAEIYSHNYLAPRVTIGTNAVVTNNTIIGIGAIIKTDIIVASESLVGAGSYISKNTKIKGVYGEKCSELYGCISDKINNAMI